MDRSSSSVCVCYGYNIELMIMSQLDIMYLQYCVCICIYREMMMMMMVMILMVDVVVLVISASDNRWGSLVGLGRGEIEGSTFFRVKRVCHSRSFAWSVGFVVLAVRWFYYVWLGRWEREIFRAMTRRAACWGYSVIVVSDRAGRSH